MGEQAGFKESVDLPVTNDMRINNPRWPILIKGVVFSPSRALREIVRNTASVFKSTHRLEKDRRGGYGGYVMVNRTDDQLYCSLKGKMPELHVVGDGVVSRKAVDATYDGYKVEKAI